MNLNEITETIICLNHIDADITQLRTIAETIVKANNDDDTLAEITIQIERPMTEEQKALRKKTGAPRIGGFVLQSGKAAQPIDMIGQSFTNLLNSLQSGDEWKKDEPADEDYESLSFCDMYYPSVSIGIINILIAEKQNARQLCLHRLTQLGVTLPIKA